LKNFASQILQIGKRSLRDRMFLGMQDLDFAQI